MHGLVSCELKLHFVLVELLLTPVKHTIQNEVLLYRNLHGKIKYLQSFPKHGSNDFY